MSLIFVDGNFMYVVVYSAAPLVSTLVELTAIEPMFCVTADIAFAADVTFPDASSFETVGVSRGTRYDCSLCLCHN